MAKILLVEDDNNLREIYQARLVAEGYDIVAAQNGEEALVVAKQNKPDLIISDVMMPRISGFEMLDILRNTDELKHTKVIMLTALGQAEDQKRADNLGADKYLVKSQVTLEDIVNAAKELLTESGAPMPAGQPTEATPAEGESEPEAGEPAPAEATDVPVVAEPIAPAPLASAPVLEPAATIDPVADSASAVPASVVPQPDTTVVVPPAPADPTPPAVTVIPTGQDTPAVDAPASDAPAAEPPAVPAPSDTTTQTIEKEEAELQAQIDDYAKAPAEPAIAVEPEPAEETSASNEETLADAVQELNAPAEEPPLQPPSIANTPAEPVATPPADGASVEAPTTETSSDSVSVAGKKVIQPINAVTKPDINELLAKEERTSAPADAAPTVGGTTATAQPPQPPQGSAVPGQSFDPNTAL